MTTVFTSLKTLHYLKYPSVFENFYFEKKKTNFTLQGHNCSGFVSGPLLQ